jgi:hypothetical protein
MIYLEESMLPSIHTRVWGTLIAISLVIMYLQPGCAVLGQQLDNSNPPDHPVKLIFIHHSTGENWLRDDYGGLGQELSNNNYFVSDTNYGWGPDAIGDRTDIPNWLEWFRSDQTAAIMTALFKENSQNSSYTRLTTDPGGENEIILFKSCFPNSALEGYPDDPPSAEGWLTVGHAKYVYNEILQYFSTRPDKLFIVITAPPLSDPTYAENSRAFNQWLFNDWLDENGYSLPNVAVFDFYNTLTATDAHHRTNNGIIEHTYGSSNTLSYPSGDDHPSRQGSLKATVEFLPLLNIFYHRWAESQLSSIPVAEGQTETASPSESPTQTLIPERGGSGVPLPPETVLSIADFETGSSGWTASREDATDTTIRCGTEQATGSNGSSALRIDFSVAPGSWATCGLLFDTPQDWNAGEWIRFEIHSDEEFQPFNVILYAGTPDNRQTYLQKRETPAIFQEGFIPLMSMWKDLLRADWEENAGSSFAQPGQVIGLAFGFDAGPDSSYTGSIWIDNIRLEKSPTYPEPGNFPKNGLPCLGIILLPIAALVTTWAIARKPVILG